MSAIAPKQSTEIVPLNPAQEPSTGADDMAMFFVKQITTLLDNVGQLAGKVQGLAVDQNKQFEAQAKRIDQLSVTVEFLEAKLSKQDMLHQAEIRAFREIIETMGKQLSSLSERVEKLDGKKI